MQTFTISINNPTQQVNATQQERFSIVSSQDIESARQSSVPKNTQKNTKSHLNTYEQWTKARSVTRPLIDMYDNEFKQFEKVLDGEVKRLNTSGYSGQNKAKPLTIEEEKTLFTNLDQNKPRDLQKRVFLHCGIHFHWRGIEGHYERQKNRIICTPRY